MQSGAALPSPFAAQRCSLTRMISQKSSGHRSPGARAPLPIAGRKTHADTVAVRQRLFEVAPVNESECFSGQIKQVTWLINCRFLTIEHDSSTAAIASAAWSWGV